MRLAVVACLLAAGVAPALPPNYEDAPLRAITFADAREGWAVGDEGVIWHTIDAGQTWERQPSGTRASLRAVQFLTPYTGFVAGRTELPNRMGSAGVLLATTDGGVTWTTVTETLLPGLNAVQFFDDKRGVVAGDGSDSFPSGVFRTEDGGRSWTMGKREEWLAATKAPDGGTPRSRLENEDAALFPARASLSSGDEWQAGEFGTVRWLDKAAGQWVTRRSGGQRPAVVFVFRRSADIPLAAVAALAADGYLCFAVANDDDANHRLPAAVRQAGGAGAHRGGPAWVANLKPDVVVTDLPADGAAAAKVYTPAAGPGDGVVSLNLTAYVPELGGSPRDVAEPAALLFGPTPQPDRLHFKLVGGTMAKDAAGHKSLMEGIHLGEGGTARRKKPAPAGPEREKVAAVRRELEQQLAEPPTAETVAAAVAKLKTLPEADAARAGTMLGFRLAHAGRWTTARELFACVAENYPAYPDAAEAIRWLVRFHSSGEARRRVELGHFPLLSPTGWAEEPADRVQQASHTAELTPTAKWRFHSTQAAQGWVRQAVELHPKLVAFGAAYARDPGLALAVGTANRLSGLPARAGDRYAALVSAVAEPWAGRLGEELRLLGRAGEFPKGPAIGCRFVRTKPFLDGKLDDPCWKDAEPVAVADGTARLLCDDQFLYVGVECKGPATGERLSRDGDLSGRDRVELQLDVDRDYGTAYRIAVDAAGGVADDCWGDSTWNPKLFVATAKTADGWAVELAIPLAELSGAKPSPAQPWAAGVARRKAGEAEPAALGLLRFVPYKNQTAREGVPDNNQSLSPGRTLRPPMRARNRAFWAADSSSVNRARTASTHRTLRSP